MTKKRTRWFPVGTNPARVGPYETQHADGTLIYTQNWNGRYWGLFAFNASDAARDGNTESFFRPVRWRGLASDPEAK